MKRFLLLTCLFPIIISAFCQESILKEFAENRRPTKWMNPICLYPSTLRMINLAQDPNFNAMVNDIEKILIFTLDSTTTVSKEYKNLLKEYESEGFEEYMTLSGKQQMKILGKRNEYIGVASVEYNTIAFYMRGDIPFGKIPSLLQTFQSNDVLPMITDQFNFK